MQQQSKTLPLVAGKLLSLAKGSKSWMSPLSLPSRRLLGNHLVEKSELAAGRRIGERLHGDVARALQSSVAELVGDVTASSSEWLLIRELLENKSETELLRARQALGDLFGNSGDRGEPSRLIALIGLRGAGKSTLGPMLAED